MDKDLREASRDPYSTESMLARLRAGDLNYWDLALAALCGCENAKAIVPAPTVPPHVRGELTKAAGYSWEENKKSATILALKLNKMDLGEAPCDGCYKVKKLVAEVDYGGEKSAIYCNSCLTSGLQCENSYIPGLSVEDFKKHEDFYKNWAWVPDKGEPPPDIYRAGFCEKPSGFLVGARRRVLCNTCANDPIWARKKVRLPIKIKNLA